MNATGLPDPAGADADAPARAPTFDELVRDGLALIPAYAPGWTDHNPSDPGITLVELFAYFAEILGWRALRVTPDARLNLLRLLDGGPNAASDALFGMPPDAVDAAIRARVRALAHERCAVTPEDFERLAVEAAMARLGPLDPETVVRARCIVGRALRRTRGGGGGEIVSDDAPADVSIVLAADPEPDDDALDRLCREVRQAVAPRCLLTTRLSVVAPAVLDAEVACRIAFETGVAVAATLDAIDAALRLRFDAQPFGRALHLAEVAAAIDRVPGVDYVDDVVPWRIGGRRGADAANAADALIGLRVGRVARPGADARLGGRVSAGRRRLRVDAAGEAAVVEVEPWETVRVRLARDAAVAIDPGAGNGG